MNDFPVWIAIVCAVGAVAMLYSIAVALEGLTKAVNSQNVVLNQIRLAIAKQTDD